MAAGILNQLAEAVVDGDDDLAEELAQQVLDKGAVDPYNAIIKRLARNVLRINEIIPKKIISC